MDSKLKKEMIILPNTDKGSWYEKYDENHHGFDILVHPFKLILAGKPNSGKTLCIHNLFLRIQTSGLPFDTLIIIQPGSSTEYDHLDPTIILNDIPDVESIICPDNGKTLIIIDDFELSKLNKIQLKNINMLFRYVSSHHNISVMLSYQSFFDIPAIMRKTCNYFILYKTNNIDEMSIIAKRVGFTKKPFIKLFRENITDKHDFLLIDMQCPEQYQIRKNFYEVLNYDEYDDI